MTTAKDVGQWSFDRNSAWVNRYPTCSNKTSRVAPLNVDTNNVSPCHALCRLNIKYEPTTCNVSMINNIPTVTFSPTCILKFKNEFFFLRKMTLHRHSMHTVNESYYDMEILLYHNRNPISDADGGVILSILLKKGADYGGVNEFLNEFINQMPANSSPVEQEIQVSSDWNPMQLLPDSKSFFYYDGALPFPPCSPNWAIIIFEEAVGVAQNIIDTMGYLLSGDPSNPNPNVRPIQRTPKDVVIFYNPNSKFDSSQDMSEAESATTALPTLPTTPSVSGLTWLKRYIYYIKGIVITIILVLMMYIAIKFASIIVKDDILNSFIIRQLKKRENRQIESSKAAMAEQQAMETGVPVQQTKLPNNNNNN
jgi:carbonic anhydrase